VTEIGVTGIGTTEIGATGPQPPDGLPRGLRIAIDGPAASGKSTLGEALARRLGYTFVDSGVVYRAVTLLALRQGVDLLDAEALTRLAEGLRIEVTRPTLPDGRQFTAFVDGEDVTWALRSPEVDAAVSAVSAVPGVRRAAYRHLRRLISPEGTVMVGRDIGTVVMPDADLKIYLTAGPEARAYRRATELAARGQPADHEAILRDLRRRDAYDASREASPMRPAEDAVLLTNDEMDVEAEVAYILDRLRQKRQQRQPARADPEAGGRGEP
jgi:cytidylate kinase